MVEVELFLDKPIEHSAAVYFEKAKKAKKKLEGAKAALKKTKLELEKALKGKEAESTRLEEQKSVKHTKQEWYEKYRWFYSSEGFLCIGGRDSTTNEILIKKHTEPNDIVFHTKIEGSPFFIVKTGNKTPGKQTLEETAQATASYSKGWKLGMAVLETFNVRPDQLSKQAPSGEFVPKGAFTVKGGMKFIYAPLQVAIGTNQGKIIGGPVEAIKHSAEKHVILIQGKESTSNIAKQIQKKIGGDLDEIIKFIPSGGSKIKS